MIEFILRLFGLKLVKVERSERVVQVTIMPGEWAIVRAENVREFTVR